jgi:hypothetical protein
VPHP